MNIYFESRKTPMEKRSPSFQTVDFSVSRLLEYLLRALSKYAPNYSEKKQIKFGGEAQMKLRLVILLPLEYFTAIFGTEAASKKRWKTN